MTKAKEEVKSSRKEAKEEVKSSRKEALMAYSSPLPSLLIFPSVFTPKWLSQTEVVMSNFHGR